MTTQDKSFKFFVGGLPPDAWEDDLRQHYSQYGKVKEVQVLKDVGTYRNRGFGFVTMETDEMKDSIFKNIHLIKSKKVEVREMQTDAASNLKRRIFVGGINPAVNEEQLGDYFKQFGEIEKLSIMRDGEGKSRRFGFIVFSCEDTLPKVLKKNIHHLDDSNKVEVRAAETRKNNQQAQKPPGPAGVPGGDLGGMYATYLSQYYGRGYGMYGGPYAAYGAYPPALGAAPGAQYQYPNMVGAMPQQAAAGAGSYPGGQAPGSYGGADSGAAAAAAAAMYGGGATAGGYGSQAATAAYLAQHQLQFDSYGPQRLNDVNPQMGASQAGGRGRGAYRAGPY